MTCQSRKLERALKRERERERERETHPRNALKAVKALGWRSYSKVYILILDSITKYCLIYFFAHAAGPFALACCFVGCVFRFSAEIRLVSGRSFAVTCFTNHGDFGTDVVSFGSPNVSFGMLGAFNLAPWGTITRFRGTWEHKKEDLGVTDSTPRSDWSCGEKALAF